ncbi:uncharacterized protein BO88DRAFT_408170 [Aspergillus vadensis CBS 113365]|uniref:Uncharacterized protein n=1 Tax=Aspergillus vadensis (strain CBS 113365 / IMI 142717 / IBT 24658) TaxID=1448311 RepID=A0A319AX88_ASPVC|nr:hypothetical protein BO88DRAFT_408170 [Aspergillus vadensis CBS 113365]PYH64859.1 hypothetical protein BO88DRAFT_408170 [Aspergillus vadensis CBS 113365]
MSAESLPISPAAFAEAIKELPLPVLYAKVSEIRNSMAHLHRSNQELRTFINESCDTDSEKQELEAYIKENEDVAVSMLERIELLKTEVENRGQKWIELDDPEKEKENGEGTANGSENGTVEGTEEARNPAAGNEDRNQDHDQDEDPEGVYL